VAQRLLRHGRCGFSAFIACLSFRHGMVRLQLERYGVLLVRQAESAVARYVIELDDEATGEIVDVLVVETERDDELIAMTGSNRLRRSDLLPLSASDIDKIVVRFDLNPPEVFFDGWLRRWSFLDELPYTIHTRRELRLMLAGEKPLSAFVDDTPEVSDNGIVPEEIFAPYVSSGHLVKRERKSLRSGHLCREVLYAVPSEAWRIDAYLLLMDILDQGCWSEGMERMQGRLLGYTDSQNDIYIALLRKRQSDRNIPGI